jgi:hypothetical protein
MRRAILLGAVALLVAVPVSIAAVVPGSPSVTTGSASSIKDTSATVHGTVNPEGQLTRYAFQYGPTSSYGHETALTSVGAGTSTVSVSVGISGLTLGTTYHYRIIAISTGGTATGADEAFKTTGSPPPPPPPKPAAATGPALSVGTGTATLTGQLDPNGHSTTYYFEFGPTAAYGFQTTPQSAGAGTAIERVTAPLSGLAPGTVYHFRLDAVSIGGTALGSDFTFQTATPPPGASALVPLGPVAFVGPTGVASTFVSCFGASPCSGTVTLTRFGNVIGRRTGLSFGPNSGSRVRVSLNGRGRFLIAHRHHPFVTVTTTSSTGQSSSVVVQLMRFS